jgi:osmotically-inducible protein OsmY
MSDDDHLKQAVLDELQWEPSVNAAHIGVTARDGVITLMGHVEHFFEKAAAEKAARRVSAVKAVVEEMEVKLPFSVRYGDEDIAAAALNRFKWNATVKHAPIQVKVEKGWVTLTGEVEWRYQQDAAVHDVRGLWGVIGVSNQITVKPRPSADNIRDRIMAALDRAWFSPADIHVAADGGKVTLSGHVGSWFERDEAGATAWAAPGTTAVKNDIRVH